MKTFRHLWQYPAKFFLDWEMFQTTIVEQIKTHFIFNNFIPKNRAVCEIMSKKYGGAKGTTYDVTIWRMHVTCCISKVTCTHAHAHAHASGYTHTQICNIYCFSTATMIFEGSSMLRYTYIACLVCPRISDWRLVHICYTSPLVNRLSAFRLQFRLSTLLIM